VLCHAFLNTLPGVFPEILYTNRHSCKKRAVIKLLVKMWRRKREEEDEIIEKCVCAMEKRVRERQHTRQVK
jgi:alcohol dehydrogenase YqhD (iron-dependent ADH family)